MHFARVIHLFAWISRASFDVKPLPMRAELGILFFKQPGFMTSTEHDAKDLVRSTPVVRKERGKQHHSPERGEKLLRMTISKEPTSEQCASATPTGSEMPDLTKSTDEWRRLARYSVYRTQGFAVQRSEVKTILHTDQTFAQAIAKVSLAEAALRKEPGYRPWVMSRALIGMQLENPIAIRKA